MKYFILVITISLVLSSCTPSAEAIQAAIAKTQTAMPTHTVVPKPTKIPLKSIDLSSVIFQPGDLPAGYESGQVRSRLSDFTKNGPAPDNYVSQAMSHNGVAGGLVDILVYEDIGMVQKSYDSTVYQIPGNKQNANIAENSMISVSILMTKYTSLAFERCHAVVVMQFQGNVQSSEVISYATRLDSRLQKIACP
jgi:hypothetical protein